MDNTEPEHDRAAIVQLTIDYCWALDTGNWEVLRRIFTPDAVADLGHGGQDGVEEIIDRVSSALAPLDDSQHMVSNHQISFDLDLGRDRDRATGRCYLQAQHIRHAARGGALYTIGGRYEDEYVRTLDGWRIAERTIVTMWWEGNRGVFSRSEEA